jgi:hypothetical protein
METSKAKGKAFDQGLSLMATGTATAAALSKLNSAKDEETLQLEEYQKIEDNINATIIDQLSGKLLQYGQIIQLLHVSSNKFLAGLFVTNTTQTGAQVPCDQSQLWCCAPGSCEAFRQVQE